MKPGIYSLEAARYYLDDLGDTPTLNATVAKALIADSPLHAWTAHPKLNPEYRESVDKKFDVGSAAHEIFLLGNDHLVHVLDPSVKDWRSNAAKEVRDKARAEGLTPLLASQWQDVSAMLTALRAQLPRVDAAPPLFVDGKAEQTAVWEDRGVLCRARLDYLHDDYSACDDMKSTAASANPLAWGSRTLWSISADIQAAMTVRAIKAITGVDTDFRFVVIESKPPFAMSVVRLGPAALQQANHKLDRALEKWKRCLETDTWPAYTTQVLDADPPAWAESQMWEAEQLEEAVAA